MHYRNFRQTAQKMNVKSTANLVHTNHCRIRCITWF